MRNRIKLLVALLLCVSMAFPVLATQFVPSITYKDGPGMVEVVQGEAENLENGEDVSYCVVVTSVTDAQDKTTDISQEKRDLLLEIYEELSDGTMNLPMNPGYVVRDLVYVSHREVGCIEQADHHHEEALEKEGIVVRVRFDLGVAPDEDVQVLSYYDGEWAPVVSVVNNGDGTVTCVMERSGPVAFCVESAQDQTVQITKDSGRYWILWIVLIVLALIAIGWLVWNRRKFTR